MDQKVNVLPQNIKLLEENVGKLSWLWIWQQYTFVMTPKA